MGLTSVESPHSVVWVKELLHSQILVHCYDGLWRRWTVPSALYGLTVL